MIYKNFKYYFLGTFLFFILLLGSIYFYIVKSGGQSRIIDSLWSIILLLFVLFGIIFLSIIYQEMRKKAL